MTRVKSRKAKKLNKIFTWIIFSLAIVSGSVYGIYNYAKADDVLFKKDVTVADDGTYRVSLNITGDADTTSTESKANVLIVYDTSGSMKAHVPYEYGSWGHHSDDGLLSEGWFQLYKKVGDNYIALTDDEKYTGTLYRVTSSGWWGTQYGVYTPNDTDKRYYSYTRAMKAEATAYDFADALLAHNTQDQPNNVQMALVTFNTNASQTQGWTNNKTTFLNLFAENAASQEYVERNYDGITNWEAALQQALTTLGNADKDPTFVVFITDGAPNRRVGSNNKINNYDAYNYATDEARKINTYNTAVHNSNTPANANTKLYGIYAFGDEADYLDDLLYFAQHNTHRPNSEGGATNATVTTPNYFKADTASDLNNAIASIFTDIVNTLGVREVGVHDGTTNEVSVSSGTLSEGMVNFVPGSFEYYLTMNVSGMGPYTLKKTDPLTNEELTITVTKNDSTGKYDLTWTTADGTNHSVTGLEGTVKSGKFKFKWTGSNDLYPLSAGVPEATYNNGAVDWNLAGLGTLLDSVTYTVEFNLYPTQSLLDLVADVKNNLIDYRATTYKDGSNKTVNPKVWKYLDENLQLKTNTDQESPASHAYVTYNDSRDNLGQRTEEFNQVDPVETVSAEDMAVTKEWPNGVDQRPQATSMELGLNKDNASYMDITLGEGNTNNSWSKTINISVGMITVHEGNVSLLAPGHDYSFSEDVNLTYHWELSAPTVHPMIINGTTTMLVLVTDTSTVPSALTSSTKANDVSGDYYKLTINNTVKYYKVDEAVTNLTAYNYRRSLLDVKKVVTGKSAPEDSTFTFTYKINDSTITTPTQNGDDIWFSIRDEDEIPVFDAVVTNATAEGNKTVDTNAAGVTDVSVHGDLLYYRKDGSDVNKVLIIEDQGNGVYLVNPGFYYARSGSEFTVEMKAGYDLRITNLPTGTTYTITEGTLDDGYNLVSVVEGTHKSTNATYNGTIAAPNTKYLVTYTNEYTLTDVPVTKVWDDNNNQDGFRPDKEADDGITLKLTGGATDITKTIKPGDDGVTVSTDENGNDTWSYTFKDLLAKDAEGNEYNYKVDEVNVPEHYEKVGTVTGDALHGFVITNKHTPEKIDSIKATKSWDDNNDQDGLRDEVSISLYANDVMIATVTVDGVKDTTNEGNRETAPWVATFYNLDKYADGSEITYRVDEDAVPTGYTKGTITGNKTDGFIIPNSHVTEKTTLDITKVWDDDDDRDGLRPDKENNNGITVKILDITDATNKITVRTETLKALGEDANVTINEETGNWEYTVTNLEKYKNGGTLIIYDVEETPIANYNTDNDGKPAYQCVTDNNNNITGYIIINSHDIASSDLEVTKVWEDFGDANGIRPDSVSVTLTGKDGSETVYTDTKPINKPTGNTTDTWTYKFLNVPTYANGGHTVSYTITETPVKGYKEPKVEGLKVTNTLDSINIPVTKKWVDDNDRDGIRPTSVKLTLQRKLKGTEGTFIDVKTVDVTAANSTVTIDDDDNTLWAYTFENLNKYNNQGVEYEYQVVELEANIPTDYDMTRDGSVITNTHSIATSDLEVTKVWEDFGDANGIRPNSVSVTLTGKDGSETVYTNTQPISKPEGNETNTWTYKFLDVPTYANGGHEVSYTITETPVKGYKEPKIEGLKVTNTLDSINIPVTKKWVDDNDRDGIRPTLVKLTLQRKTANDTDYTDVKTIEVTASNSSVTTDENGDTLWAYTFENLNKYDNQGREYTYQVVELEANIPTDYDMSTACDDDGTEIIINSHDITTDDLEVTKVWEDFDDANGIRPDSVSVTLTGKDGNETVYTNTQPINKPEGNTTDTWTYKFLDVPTYANGGHEVSYTITETPVKGYKEPKIEGLKVTNELDSINIPVTKKWVDDNDRDGIRPDNVKLTLQRRIKDSGSAFTDVITVDVTATNSTVSTDAEENTLWDYIFKNYNKYNAEGKEYEYQVVELKTNIPEDYDMTQSGSVITNMHGIETDSIMVTKVWDDFDNTNGIRPQTITVTLKGTIDNGATEAYSKTLAIGPETEGVTVGEDANGNVTWTYKFADVPMYAEGGKVINYTVSEAEVKGYNEPNVDGFKITNTLDSINIPVTKKWVDDNDRDGIRPDEVKLTLQRRIKDSGSEFTDVKTETITTRNATVSIDSDKNTLWAYTFENYNKYDAEGNEYEYQVVELEANIPSDYDMTRDGSVITNTHSIETDDITVTKVWDDDSDRDGERPDTVTLYLLADGKKVGEIELDATDGDKQSYTFPNMPTNRDGGTAIKYTADEASVPTGYEKDDNDKDLSVTNSYSIETRNITVKKVWDDDNNRDGNRPTEGATVNLMDGDTVVGTVTLKPGESGVMPSTDASGRDTLSYTFINLPVNKDHGETIEYSISEEAVGKGYGNPLYTSENANTLIVTNPYSPETVSVKVTKVWVDDSNRDGERPETITLLVMDGTTEADRHTINARNGDEMSWLFEGLPKYKNGGTPIKYTASEVSVPGYTMDENIAGDMDTGYTITNRRAIATVDIPFTKVWDDSEDQDGLRPDKENDEGITVKLMDGSEVVASKTIKQTGDTWSGSFDGVPKYKNGGTPITYTISEETVPGYKTTIDQDKREITNKHTPETIDIYGSKVWVDESDAEGFRPTKDGVTVKLYADEVEIDSTVVKGEGDEWTYSFTKLPKYKEHGVEIKYTVDEDPVDNYEKFIDTEKAPYVIVNTHTLNELSIKVTKDWVDAPEDGIANLYGHTDKIDVVLVGRVGTTEYVHEPWTLTKEDNWTHTFTELPEYRQGDYVTYTVEEITDVQDYDRELASNADENELIVRNIYKPTDYVTISGEKIWSDDDDRDGLRPDEITLTITDQYDNEVATVTVKESEDWKYSIKLPKYGNGVELEYKITEENVATGYTSEVTDYNVTNTHEIATVSFNITKIWSDNNNHDNIRPDSITVRIMDGETEVAKKTISPCEENNYTWTYTFKGLPKYKNGGELIEYKIVEDPVAGYTYTLHTPEDDTSEDYTIENIHTDSVIDIIIRKIWDDMDDVSMIRPDKINVTLYADSEPIKELVITAADNWEMTITGLTEFNAGGTPIVYSVVEEAIPEYETTYETDGNILKIKNHHELGIGGSTEEEPPQTGIIGNKKNNGSLAFILSNMLGLAFFVRKTKEF